MMKTKPGMKRSGIFLVLCVAAPMQVFAADASPAAPVISPQVILAPTEVRADPMLAKGCWVRLFPQPEFKGQDELTVAGPMELPSLRAPAGNVYWKQKAESLIAGPKATVTVFEHKSYGGPSATLKPGAQEAQLRKTMKLPQSIDSLKISCDS